MKGEAVKYNIIRMTTFIKTKFKKSDVQTNIDKYRIAVSITEYHNISKFIFLRIVIPKIIISCNKCMFKC